jgi:signal peptidase I
MRSVILKEALSWALVILGAVAAALLLRHFVIVNANVPSGSMLETIQVDSRIVANRLSYLFSEPKRLDVVVFRYPLDEDVFYVKRVIGLPNETVEIRNGRVFIDGVELPEEAYVSSIRVENLGPFHVPEGSYFMLGDNRNNSDDSRRWGSRDGRYSYVAKDKILGKVIFSYYPSIRMIR